MKGFDDLDGPWREGARLIEVYRGGQCIECGQILQRGEPAWWLPKVGAMECGSCHERVEAASPHLAGEPGRSARTEWERRHAKDGGGNGVVWGRPRVELDRASTAAWAIGARGEEVTGRALCKVEGKYVKVLHDRAIPNQRGNIDHVAIGPDGVYVIDSKYENGAVTLRHRGGLATPHLFVGSRDRSDHVSAAQRQARIVRNVLARHELSTVRVKPVLCFVDTVLDLQGQDRTIDGVRLTHPDELSLLVTRRGPLDPDAVQRLFQIIGVALPRKVTS